MDLSLFFNSLEESLWATLEDPQSLFQNIKVHYNGFPEWQEADIAFIGLLEHRGTLTNKGVEEAAIAIRKPLYRLKKGTGTYKIVDLGDLRNGVTLKETYLRLKEVCEHLLDHQVIPVIIGGSHDLMLGQFWAYQHLDRIISIANVDAYLNLTDHDQGGMNQHHLLKILTHYPNYLFNLSQIGLQTYLNSKPSLEVLEKLYFNVYAIGEIREDFNEIEPAVREADLLAIDLTALKMADAPANIYAGPFGLTGEELCQICWYAGLSDTNSSVGIYEYNPRLDVGYKTAKVIAIALWYFIEGYYHRLHQQDFKSTAFTKYVANVSATDHQAYDIVFYKQIATDKWWMEVPYPESNMQAFPCIIPCSYRDYQNAVNGEVPNRWLNTHAKLI
ncbi:MAG: formimidoylglutamase [Bacteroidota bacterium]